MTVTCNRCPARPELADAYVCKRCQEVLCPDCAARHRRNKAECTPGDAAATGQRRHVRWPAVAVAETVRTHDEWEDL